MPVDRMGQEVARLVVRAEAAAGQRSSQTRVEGGREGHQAGGQSQLASGGECQRPWTGRTRR